MLGRRPGVGARACDDGTSAREFEDTVLNVVLGEVREVRAEGVRLDAVNSDLEVGIVHGRDDIGPRNIKNFIAALISLEVVKGRISGLEHRAHRAVGDHDSGG